MKRICPVRAQAVAPVTSSFRVSPLPFNTAVLATGLVSLVEIQFTSGTRYYSYDGVAAPGQWWKDAILAIGSFTREVPVLPGEYRVSDAQLDLDDTDGEFSTLKATEPFRNVRVIIRHGDIAHGLAGLPVVFTGEITNYRIGGGTCSLTVRDISWDRFREPLSVTFLPTDFPNMPPDYLGHVIPVVMGRHEDTAIPAAEGVLPAYLVDPAVGSSDYVYVVARHPCKSVFSVFHHRTLLAPSAYTVGVQIFGSHHCQVIKFPTDMRTDPPAEAEGDEFEIAVNAEGMDGTGWNTGALMDNPVSQFRFTLSSYLGLQATEFDEASWEACRAELDTLNYGAPSVHGESIRKDEIIARFETSFGLVLYPTRFGTFGLYSLRRDLEGGPLPAELTDQYDILRDTFSVEGYPDPLSRLVYQYGWHHARSFFLRRPHHVNEAEEARLKRDIRDVVDLWFVRDDYTALDVARRRHAYALEGTQLVSFDLPETLFGLELNTRVRLTHWEGIAEDGLGYRQRYCRITGLHHQLSPSSMKVTVNAVVIPDLPPELAREDFTYAHGWRLRDGRLIQEE